MTWADAGVMALRELRRRPGRAVLTVLAVALAAALLSALLTIAGTARTRVLSQLSHGGSLAGISIEPNFPNPAQQNLDDPVPGPPNPITGAALARIRQLPDVLSVYPVMAISADVQPQGATLPFTTTLLSANLAHVSALPITLLAGRTPTAGSKVEVDVGGDYLKRVGLTNSEASRAVGTHITLTTTESNGNVEVERRVVLDVVGVVDQQLGSGDLVAWPALGQGITSFESIFGPEPASASPYIGAVVIANQLSQVAAVRSAIATVGYSTTAPVGLIVSVGRYLHVVELVLSGIGIVALGIAALGIANALMAAIRERRREIGVLKAIGARDRDVLRLFLLEATSLGLVGGLLGVVLGIAMAGAISANANAYLHSQGLAGVALSVPVLLPVGAVLGSAVVALVAGTLPAWRAARLPAREAVDV